MGEISWLVFALAVFVGSYVQAVTGFALGMIVIAVVGGSGVISLPVLTAAASIVTMVNVALALKGHVRMIQRNLFLPLAAGQLPAIWAGVALLTVLDQEAQIVLQLLLGGFITLGCLSMMLRPEPRRGVSKPPVSFAVGLAGGVVGGLFSASGPIMGWFCYRQPLEVAAIRATLLASFALTTSTRTVVVGFQGGLTPDVWWLVVMGLPLVVAGTWLGRELPPPVADSTLRRGAFGLLLAMGLWILVAAVLRI